MAVKVTKGQISPQKIYVMSRSIYVENFTFVSQSAHNTTFLVLCRSTIVPKSDRSLHGVVVYNGKSMTGGNCVQNHWTKCMSNHQAYVVTGVEISEVTSCQFGQTFSCQSLTFHQILNIWLPQKIVGGDIIVDLVVL